MSISVNGQSQVPPGFRFHPTEEELLQYYLRKKVSNEKIDLDVILDVDLNKLEPWDIQEKCRIGSAPQNDWYFFSHKDKKYPTGTRTNRATAAGFWKATGRDKAIYTSHSRIGMRKTLVFYKGRAPHGHKSDWIMHEYPLEDNRNPNLHDHDNNGDQSSSGQEEGWVICRIFKKKSYHKSPDGLIVANCDHGRQRSTYHRWESNIKYPLDRDLVSSSNDKGALENGRLNNGNNNNNNGMSIQSYDITNFSMNSLSSSSSSAYNINDWATFVDGMVTSQHNYCQISGEIFPSNININHHRDQHLLSSLAMAPTINFPLPLIKPADDQDEMLDLWTPI